jgi:hypothetical protein
VRLLLQAKCVHLFATPTAPPYNFRNVVLDTRPGPFPVHRASVYPVVFSLDAAGRFDGTLVSTDVFAFSRVAEKFAAGSLLRGGVPHFP